MYQYGCHYNDQPSYCNVIPYCTLLPNQKQDKHRPRIHACSFLRYEVRPLAKSVSGGRGVYDTRYLWKGDLLRRLAGAK